MKEIQFTIKLNASKEIVWTTLWDDLTFRDWANIIDEGTYMKGALKEGNEIQFISSVNGYGVTSLIEKLNLNEFLLLRHNVDTKERGQREREKEWTGGKESYSLTEINGVTTLDIKIDVPEEQVETFNIRFPKALDRIKTLAEKMQLNRLNRNGEVESYNSLQSLTNQNICNELMDQINKKLPDSKSKIWHGSPVWFIDDNPVVGYCKLKDCIQLLFWSGQTFDEEGLKSVGKYKAAEARYKDTDEINRDQLSLWLTKSIEIQWDYKNIAKRKGELFRLK